MDNDSSASSRYWKGPPRPRSIRWWLGGIVGGIAIPLLLLLVLIYGADLRRERDQARAGALRIARATALRLRTRHRESLSLLNQMAGLRAVQSLDREKCRSFFSIVDFFPQYADLYLFDQEGKIVCSAEPAGEDARISLLARQWIQNGGAAKLQPGHPLIRTIGAHWTSVLTTKVTGLDGQANGTLLLLQLPEVISREDLPGDGVVWIRDQAGDEVAWSDDAQSWRGQRILGKPGSLLVSDSTDEITQAKGMDGIHRQYGFTRIPEMGWTVFSGVPTAAVMEPVRLMFVRGLIAGLGIVVILSIVAFTLVDHMERSVRILSRAASAVSRGDYVKVEPSGPLEIAALAMSFNDMVDRRKGAEEHLRESERSLQALSDRLIVVQEEERGRISRELHDDLGQSLTALKMDVLGLLQSRQGEGPSPITDRILETIDLTITAVQRISSELRPSVLDDLGLIPAIEADARVFEDRTGIECELSLPEDLRIEGPVANAIYRIIQEALTNVARHSNATRVELRLRQRAGEILLEVRDDGCGLTEEQSQDASSLGLIGMRERAHLIGGKIEFQGVQNRGTIVSLRIPTTPRAT